ncbi:hypothetical protein SLA_2428 [Streptomyces laurentii]|uniref:Uncharacterized protein n=1 Tax=Streptomyces laurentii TaxID=39478 RepID=A0A160NYV9_STRLU|nr:hypothetical protein SLA_2428 [Streptomyces laurentii]
MTGANTTPAARGLESTAVVTRKERRAVVAGWLLGAALNRREAVAGWQQDDVATLACGRLFSAVRVPADLVFAAAGNGTPPEKATTAVLEAVDVFLSGWLDGGAVVMDIPSRLYFFLMPARAGDLWPSRQYPGVVGLGRNAYLGIPVVGRTRPEGRAYWPVEMDTPGDLCWPDEVGALLHRGREALNVS